MNKDNTAYLRLMLDAFRKILDFTNNVSYEIFSKDELIQSAVIMQLEVIGQLVKKISSETKKEIDISWREMSGMRDMVAHDYFTLDLVTIWDTVIKDIPFVQEKITKYLVK